MQPSSYANASIAQQQINIDERTCKARIYAAINYFSIDNNVSIKVWESNYADKYEDLAKLCAAAEDYKTMGKCYSAAGVSSSCFLK